MEAILLQRENRPDTPQSALEAWTASFRSACGRYSLELVEANAFAGWVRSISGSGFAAVEIAGRVNRVERTHRDTRLDGVDQYAAVFQIAGQSTMSQNGQVVQLAAGDVVLVDKARPVTYVSDGKSAQWLSLQLPRKSLISHLGFEPQGGASGRGGPPAGHLLYEVALNALKSDQAPFSPARSYMQLAVYDLVGALFAPDSWSGSRLSDKLFSRIRGVIRARYADPDFGPREVAAEAGISLRYVQKLFTERDSTCSEYIYSLRLDHAAHLLQRRALLGTHQPLSEVAYASGFRDYPHFARSFRHRFGCSPSGPRPISYIQV
jgi:AraC-like DNA-binding protein